MQISVVIPVYNVEKYLAECLDSVINQTFRDIEIICVNDGSTDSSPQILQRYAEKDDRITIINKANGGLSSARNAAYPHITGKYTLFVDSDDWIDPALCEKTFAKAEERQSPMTVFFWQSEGERVKKYPWRHITSDDKTTAAEKQAILAEPSAWSKLWRTDFLFHNNIRFPEGLIYEDVPANWKGTVLAERIAVVPEQLYHYRFNPNSIMHKPGRRVGDLCAVYQLVETFLREGKHEIGYGEAFHRIKLEGLSLFYGRCADEFRPEFRRLIRESLTESDRQFYRSGKIRRAAARFYRWEIDGGFFGHCLFETALFFRRLSKKICGKRK